jgi:hypothetical protein
MAAVAELLLAGVAAHTGGGETLLINSAVEADVSRVLTADRVISPLVEQIHVRLWVGSVKAGGPGSAPVNE